MGLLGVIIGVLVPIIVTIIPVIRQVIQPVIQVIRDIVGGNPAGPSPSPSRGPTAEDIRREQQRQEEERQRQRLTRKLEAVDKDIAQAQPQVSVVPQSQRQVAEVSTQDIDKDFLANPAAWSLRQEVDPDAQLITQMCQLIPGIVNAAMAITGSPQAAFGFLLARAPSEDVLGQLQLLWATAQKQQDQVSESTPAAGATPKPARGFMRARPSLLDDEAQTTPSLFDQIGTWIDQGIAIAEAAYLNLVYHIDLTTDSAYNVKYPQKGKDWVAWVNEPKRVHEAFNAVLDLAARYKKAYDEGELAPYVKQGMTQAQLFQSIMGNMNLQLVGDTLADDPSTSGVDESLTPAETKPGGLIDFYPVYGGDFIASRWNIVHEFGHVLGSRAGGYYAQSLARTIPAARRGRRGPGSDFVEADGCPVEDSEGNRGINLALCRQHALTIDENEEFADRFLFWVYEGKYVKADGTRVGFIDSATSRLVDQWMTSAMSVAYGHAVGDEAVIQEIGLPTQIKHVEPGTRLRENPGIDYTQLAVLDEKDEIKVIGKTTRDGVVWLFVVAKGYAGWVSSSLVKGISDSDIGNIPDISQAEVSEWTGRNYDENWKRVFG